MIPIPLFAMLLAATVAATGLITWNIQSWRYDAQIAEKDRVVTLAERKAEAAAREAEQKYLTKVEEIAQHAEERRTILETRAARAERAARSLRDDVAALNARAAPANPEAARFADEARRARELLGACADEYRGVALAADELRDQVIGLQAYARAVSEPQ